MSETTENPVTDENPAELPAYKSALLEDVEEAMRDVVDISLIAVMGGLCVANGNADTYKLGAACKPSAAPLGAAAFGLHDGVDQAGAKVKDAGPLLPAFPYLGTPIPGAR